MSALLQLGLSRNREFEADRAAARLTGDPEGLALALQRLEHGHAGLFGRILGPYRREPQPSLLRTHPATEARIARLLELARAAGSAPASPPPPEQMIMPLLPDGWPAITRRPRRRWSGLRF